MIKYFELLLDLLNIPDADKYLNMANIIESNLDKNLQVHHQYFFIFEWYRDLLKWKLSIDDFLQLWDIWSKLRFPNDKIDSITLLKSGFIPQKDTIYIFDWLSEGMISGEPNIFYC